MQVEFNQQAVAVQKVPEFGAGDIVVVECTSGSVYTHLVSVQSGEVTLIDLAGTNKWTYPQPYDQLVDSLNSSEHIKKIKVIPHAQAVITLNI